MSLERIYLEVRRVKIVFYVFEFDWFKSSRLCVGREDNIRDIIFVKELSSDNR
jgi:hypothetical protein